MAALGRASLEKQKYPAGLLGGSGSVPDAGRRNLQTACAGRQMETGTSFADHNLAAAFQMQFPFQECAAVPERYAA